MFSCIFYVSFIFFFLWPIVSLDNLIIQIFLLFIRFFLSIFFSWLIVFLVFFICMFIVKRLRVNHPFKKIVIKSISKLIIRFFRIEIKVHNIHLFPKDNKLIIYSNHKSHLDSFIIASIVPSVIAFSPKDELYKGFLGFFLSFCFEATGCMKIVRNNIKETIKNIIKSSENVKKGLSMVIFHEGGIKNKKNDFIEESLDGAFRITTLSKAVIVPISLKGVSFIRGKCWFRKKKVELFIHSPIYFEQYKKESTKDINKKVTSIINSVL
ncbi:1-acyl-sn-glycerol-3-phosphate acyltransferase [Texas Phoenix palm phytoplasma]|uniref:1-acyl-sn-glycerol-3-phosphate acyltransferase n=1 Tax=Texas Phoenix palm phytoplasma TaxID=176709 RepID=A0ABS5BIR6_9MOLU|nr:lysophospholipid acyltransferase family protein [Texas Phoenix palm phytoplasma]MBP3059476.1 1-acyl-sn-glycerol-3-phosphate acyltransferase [Texas Phoenix palm phytoplasma]